MNSDGLTEAAAEAFKKLSLSVFRLRNEAFRETENAAGTEQVMNLSFREVTALNVVKHLTERKDKGISLKDLANELHMNVPAASFFVDSLVKKDLLFRVEDPDDRRCVCIRLAPQGVEHFHKVTEIMDRAVMQLMRSFKENELQGIINTSDLLYNRIYHHE